MPAKAPSHYEITVRHGFDAARARFRPGARYTVTAAIHELIKAEHPGAILTETPLNTE